MPADGNDDPGPADESLHPLFGLVETLPERAHARILLLIDRDANRQQVATWLDDWYDVESDPDGPVRDALDRSDLCLIDKRSFSRHRDDLVASKDDAAPVFKPAVLLRTGNRTGTSNGSVWGAVDDVIETPASKAEMRARIGVLLRARGYSLRLQRQNDRLENFASVISHDLRNPLNVAQGRVELAMDECESEHLQYAARAHDRIATLIEDVLELARQGEAVTAVEQFRLAAIAERCRETVDMADATLVVETEQAIEADRSRLQQLFENLVRNAIDHSTGEVTIRVGDLHERTGFFVEDDGPGLSPEEHDQIFESGYTTSAEGTGLGLAIVKEIVQAHGWEIAATDSEDGGARFDIRTAAD